MKFTYDKGPLFVTGWRVTDTGDCGDFTLSKLVEVEGSLGSAIIALLTLKACPWLVKSPSNKLLPRHVALWHRDYGWSDSTFREWSSKTPNTKIFPLLPPYSLLRIAHGWIYKKLKG